MYYFTKFLLKIIRQSHALFMLFQIFYIITIWLEFIRESEEILFHTLWIPIHSLFPILNLQHKSEQDFLDANRKLKKEQRIFVSNTLLSQIIMNSDDIVNNPQI